MDMADADPLLRREAFHCRADAAPSPVISEEDASGSQQVVVIQQILINILLFVAAVQVDHVRAQVRSYQP